MKWARRVDSMCETVTVFSNATREARSETNMPLRDGIFAITYQTSLGNRNIWSSLILSQTLLEGTESIPAGDWQQVNRDVTAMIVCLRFCWDDVWLRLR